MFFINDDVENSKTSLMHVAYEAEKSYSLVYGTLAFWCATTTCNDCLFKKSECTLVGFTKDI